MKIDRILISVRPGETRIASLSQGDLIGLSFERFTKNSKVGDIFIGRIEAIVHNLQAAFVNLGDKKPGFLGLSDARPHGAKVRDTIGDYVSEGDHVLVQVIHSETGSKGPRLTLRPALSGRNLVLMPGHSGISVSKRIKDTEIRCKLRKALAKNNIGSHGYVIRTSAKGAKIEDLLLEANYLRTKWAKIQSDRIAARGPKILFRETQKAYSLLRDIDVTNLTEVVTDNLETFYHLKTYTKSEIPEIQNLISLHRQKEPLFRTELP